MHLTKFVDLFTEITGVKMREMYKLLLLVASMVKVATLKAEFRIRFMAKYGPKALNLQPKDIFKVLMNEYFRKL